jgi:succinate dehydrogenase / fumarate reductase, flavoprotein subunit
MQGLADGYFVLPYTIGHCLAMQKPKKISTDHQEFKKAEQEVLGRSNKLLSINGKRSVDSFHRELGEIMWSHCGMARNKQGLEKALEKIPNLREEFWSNVKVPGERKSLNLSLEKAGRVADFMEFSELMCRDALSREESCGGHFREEHQTPDGEAKRDDKSYCHAAVWQYAGEGKNPERFQENLSFENVQLATRSYK